MGVEDLFDSVEEQILDLLARIDDGDEKALEELKKVKRYFEELNDLLSIISEEDTIETVSKKFDKLSEKFDEFLEEIMKVVG